MKFDKKRKEGADWTFCRPQKVKKREEKQDRQL